MDALDLKEQPDGFTVRVRVIPKAHKNSLAGVEDGALVVRLTAPPVDGKANQALIAFLSKELDVAKSRIKLVRGESSRSKRLVIGGLSPDELRHTLEASIKD